MRACALPWPSDTNLVLCSVANLEKLHAEEQRLMDIVKVQNLTPEEVLRMNTEHENLSRELESLKHKIAETSQVVVRLEVSLTRKVSDAEEALDQYTNLLSTLELFPPLPPPLEDVDLTIDLHSAAANPQGLLTGADIRKVVKPTLNRIAEMKMTARADVESDRIKVDDELDQLTLECETIEEEVHEVMSKTNALNDQADELREVRLTSTCFHPNSQGSDFDCPRRCVRRHNRRLWSATRRPRGWSGTWQRRGQLRWRMELVSNLACRRCKSRTSSCYPLRSFLSPRTLLASLAFLHASVLSLPVTNCSRPYATRKV